VLVRYRLAQYISDISVHEDNLQWQQLMAQAANFNGCASCLQQLQAELQSPGETSDVVKRILAAEVSGFEQVMVAFVEKANGVLTKTFANAVRVAESDDCDVVKALTMTPPMSKTNFAKMWKSAGAKEINGLKLCCDEAVKKHAALQESISSQPILKNFVNMESVTSKFMSVEKQLQSDQKIINQTIAHLAVVQSMTQMSKTISREDLKAAAQARIDQLGVTMDPAVAIYFNGGLTPTIAGSASASSA